MGAWDHGSFDNDNACDWLWELEESNDTSVLAAALEAIIEADEDGLEAPDCEIALAAAEVVAALGGHPLPKLPDDLREWLSENEELDASALVPVAQDAIQRIRKESELKELREEGDDATKWYATLDDLTARLKACR